jgi:hypothetical protein
MRYGRLFVIVFNLACDIDHRFEGWFSSAEEFERQQSHGQLTCPACGSNEVHKRLSAPRLNLLSDVPLPPDTASPNPAVVIDPAQRHFRELVRRVLEASEDVGEKFAEEARRIHYNEVEARPIRGVASPDEARALADEGVEFVQLPFRLVDKSSLN